MRHRSPRVPASQEAAHRRLSKAARSWLADGLSASVSPSRSGLDHRRLPDILAGADDASEIVHLHRSLVRGRSDAERDALCLDIERRCEAVRLVAAAVGGAAPTACCAEEPAGTMNAVTASSAARTALPKRPCFITASPLLLRGIQIVVELQDVPISVGDVQDESHHLCRLS